jgi:hypothetical protein
MFILHNIIYKQVILWDIANTYDIGTYEFGQYLYWDYKTYYKLMNFKKYLCSHCIT